MANKLNYKKLKKDAKDQEKELKKKDKPLANGEWLFQQNDVSQDYSHNPPYGNLSELNTARLILDSVGGETLIDIAKDYLDLLGTSGAIYEKNGDYAMGIFSSGWCRFLDNASRNLCNTDSNQSALNCGRWLCHKSCWNNASKVSIEKKAPIDIECNGGIRLFAIPVWAKGKVIGSMNFGYGDPPKEPEKLKQISELYKVNIDELHRLAELYKSRSPFVIDIAKRRLLTSAKLIGQIIELRLAEEELEKAHKKLEQKVQERTAKLRMSNEELRREIEEHKRTEEALQASEKKYRSLFHYSNDGIYVHDLVGRIIEVNEKALEQSGMISEEIGSAMITELLAPISPETTGQLFLEISRQGFLNYEMIGRRKNGETFPAEVSSSLLDLGGKKVAQSVVRDISERKKLEEELLKVQKLESTGVLAGGIAHDFNNLLMAILGNISLAKLFVQTDKQAVEKLLDAEKACARAQDLTKQLLTFSKGGEPLIKPAVITDLLSDSISFTLSGSNVNSDLKVADDLWPALIDAGQISQVIQNVVKNADQAMPEGGTVTIRAQNKTNNKDDVLPLATGNYVEITIADTGVGIPAKHITKVFDPYFSTKKEGSGLGLSGAYSILKNHGGFITLDSQPGKGSTCHIYLPAIETTLPPSEDSHEPPLTGVGKILIMDDEEAVTKVATSMLAFMGYSVLAARDGAEALALYNEAKDGGNPFDAVILDLTIPGGMGGKETIQKLLKIDPEVKAIVSSGYANDPIMAKYENFGFRGVVAKPYSIQELSEVLSNVLG